MWLFQNPNRLHWRLFFHGGTSLLPEKIRWNKIYDIHLGCQKAQIVLRTHRLLQKQHQSLYHLYSNTTTPPKKRFTIQFDKIISKGLHRTEKCVQTPPILIYPGRSKHDDLFNNTFKFLFGAMHASILSNQSRWPQTNNIHFRQTLDTQCKYTALFIGAFAVHMSVKRLSFYLQDAECSILCDYKHLENSQKEKLKMIK